MTERNNYIQHLHAFRGFAIINIIGAHAWSFPIFWTGQLDSTSLTWLFNITETLFHGSTIYFAVISGLLFSLLLKERSWSQFYKSKTFNVFMPYCFMTFLLTGIFALAFRSEPELHQHPFVDYLLISTRNLALGQGSIHFWYIPVLLFLFAITPLLNAIQIKQPWILFVIALLPLVISRSPFPDFLQPQSFVYFMGAYALGMLMGHEYARTKQLIERYWLSIMLITGASTIILAMLYFWQYQATSFFSVKQTLVYIQKVGICFLVIHWFINKEQALPRWLKTVGTYSFAIYFLHVTAIWGFIELTRNLLVEQREAMLIAPLGVANLIWAVVVSMLFAKLAKFAFKNHSRKLIGA